MRILNIQNEKERKEAIFLCKNLLEKRALIPVVGAGFSLGTPTDNNGTIPSVEELHQKLFFYIKEFSGYDESDLMEIEKYNLSKLATTFWNIYDRIPEADKCIFYSYIENNFENISFRKEFQEAFLKVQWPYLFTLNYDSLIEDFEKKYYPIIPYDRINPYISKERISVYKLHGDAKKYTATGDQKYFILSAQQYIESMMNNANKDMLNQLLTAFSSKSILFLGCGLSDELDLLYSSRLSIKEKAKSIDPNQQAIIYISFETNENAENIALSRRKQDELANYGVTHVLRIFHEYQTKEFFNELAKISDKIPQPDKEAFLERFSAIKYNTLNIDDIQCRDFLFQENLIWKSIGKHEITMPGYCVNRTMVSNAIKFISSGEPLCFISGNFFSGKTYALIEVSKYFMSRKVYVFPSGVSLSNAQLDILLKKREVLCCFDSKSLTTTQIKMICAEKKLDELRKLGSSAVVVIDTSDAPMYKYIFEARNLNQEFQQFKLNNAFDGTEEPEFNKKIGAISLPPYIDKETLLDYIVDNEKELIGDSEIDYYFIKPQEELLVNDVCNRIKALIMLATEIRIPAMRAIQFGIDNAINDMIRICEKSKRASAIERDYSGYCGDSSGFEFVCNSKYWIVRALSMYANTNKNNVGIIADAYLSIIENYRDIYKDDDVKFYQNSEPYYFFDHIQTLFNHRWFPNSSRLMDAIYDKLRSVMSDSYQFLHQKAKGKLRIAQVQIRNSHLEDAEKSLKEAVYNITRAIKLAELYPQAKNIEETILHMTYTKGRILIEYSCVSPGRVPQTVETCYLLYQMQQNIRHDAYDFKLATGSDKKSFEKFKLMLMSDFSIQANEELNKEKTQSLLLRWTGMKFIISNKKNK